MNCSDSEISAEIIISNPALWYPSGYGEQNLYDIRFELIMDEKVIYSDRKKTGFRLVEIDQSPHPEKGNYFILKVNGIRIFAKGANLVPADMIIAAIDKSKY